MAGDSTSLDESLENLDDESLEPPTPKRPSLDLAEDSNVTDVASAVGVGIVLNAARRYNLLKNHYKPPIGSFSGLKRIKTAVRSSMTTERLTGLSLLHIHRDIPVNIDVAIDEFCRRHPRRMQMVDLLDCLCPIVNF